MSAWVKSLSALLVVAELLFAGCTPVSAPPTGTEPLVEGEASAEPVVRLKAAGPQGVGPTRLLIHTGADVFAPDLIGMTAPEGTALRFEPPLTGSLVVVGPSMLAFVPETGFHPATSYMATLSALATGTEVIAPPESPWTHTFSAPEFGFATANLERGDLSAGVAEVSLWFTAPVEAASITARAHATWQGTSVDSSVSATDNPYRVLLTVRSSALSQEGDLRVTLDAGVPYAFDANLVSRAGDATVHVQSGKPVEILASKVREGADGFYVDIVCIDHSLTGTRWVWDPIDYESWQVSTRCQLDPSQITSVVHLDPALDVSAAPAPGGFRVFAPFERGPYTLTIDAGATTLDGGVLPSAFRAALSIPARKPVVRFSTRGRYIPKDGWRNIPIEHRNINAIQIQVRHIPEANIVFWLNGDEGASRSTADLVYQRTFAVKNLADRVQTSWIDLSAVVPKPERGVYEIRLAGAVPQRAKTSSEDEEGWMPEETISDSGDFRVVALANSRIVQTDLHLIAKMEATQPGLPYTSRIRVFALGVSDNTSRSGVDVQLVRPSGAQLAQCMTGADGSCSLEVPAPAVDPTAPLAILARSADDFTFLKFTDLQLSTRADVSGVSYRAESPYDAALYLDRGVYRPGDVAHLSVILRDVAHVAPPAGLPAVVHLYDPTGKELRKVVAASNAAGMFSVNLSFQDFSTTGRYRASIEVAEKTVGSTSFSIEEFVPERLAVKVEASQPDVMISAATEFSATAEWLFGGAAVGSRVETTCRFEAVTFEPGIKPGVTSDWSFGPLALDGERSAPIDLGVYSAVVAADGKFVARCPAVSENSAIASSGEVRASVAVMEGDTGRATLGSAGVTVHPERYYIGLHADAPTVSKTGATTVEGKIVDWKGAPSAATRSVEVEIVEVQHEWGYVWIEAEGRSEYQSFYRRMRESAQTTAVDGSGLFSVRFTPKNVAGDYLVVAKANHARTEILLAAENPYGVWNPYSSSEDPTPRPVDPTELRLHAPELAEVGTEVRVEFVAPYAGRALLAVETDTLIEYQWVDSPAGSVAWHFTPKELFSNVYVTALLVKNPHAESKEAFIPGRAFGATSIRLQPRAFALDVRLTAAKEVRPHEPLTIHIDVGPQQEPMYATVAAVDEGILSLTDFTDPDPLAELFRKRALGVETYETIGWTLAIPPGGPGAQTGGDGLGRGGRVQMVKPVALWSGLIEIPTSGKTAVRFDLPGYQGSLRIMAVVAGKSKIGRASTPVIVRDPLVLQTTLPRFLVQGDEAILPVQVTNASGKARTVSVNLTSNDLGTLPTGVRVPFANGNDAPLLFPSGTKQSLRLGVGQAETLYFPVRVNRAPGAAHLRVEAISEELKSYEELDLPLQTALPEARLTRRTVIEAGSNDISSIYEGWLPGTEHASLWVTSDPYAPVFTHLETLIHYPYGCIEQTVSSTWPLLYAGSRLAVLDPAFIKKTPVDAMIMRGLERVLGMQTPRGEFAYWPGGEAHSPWASAYATHFLIEAKRNGRNVPQSAIEEALDALGRSADQFQTMPDPAEAYIHYVLAVGGRGRAAQAARSLERLQTSARSEDRRLFQAAIYKTGDRRHEASLRKVNASPLRQERPNDLTFWSELRGRGLELSLFADLFGSDPAAEPLADLVAQELLTGPGSSYTTQELAWGISGLGKWSVPPDGGLKKVGLRVNGTAVAPNETPKGKAPTWMFEVQRGSLASAVTLDVERVGKSPTWLVATLSGTRAAPEWATDSSGITIVREWLNRQGAAINTASVPIGQAVLVRLRVANGTTRTLDRLALVDRLPAGFEIENSRLGGSNLPDWVDSSTHWAYDHIDIRDDRFVVFGTLRPSEWREVMYTVRAVSSGTFTAPATYIEAMYDPLVTGRTTTQPLSIVRP